MQMAVTARPNGTHVLLLRLAPLLVHNATGCQQPPEWSVLGQVDCISLYDSPWESRSFCTIFIQVIHSHPGGLFQYTEGEEVKICFASTLSSIIWPIQENRQYTGVVEPQLSWQQDSRPPELVALHCCTCECTPSHDVWKAVSWRVDESAQVDKYLHCANLLQCDWRGDILNVA